MVDTPRQPAPQPAASVTKTATVSKEVTLPPHASRAKKRIMSRGPNIPLPDNTIAEQAAGRAAVDTNEDQLSAERESGSRRHCTVQQEI